MNNEEEIRAEFVKRNKAEFEGKYSFLITLVGGEPRTTNTHHPLSDA